jgi:peroxiredoxin Q/BCP
MDPQTHENVLTVGNKAPSFLLPDQTGKMHALSDYVGKWVVLYFYPKDDTPGCTTEACNFRDAKNTYHTHDIIVLGVSKDSVASHKKFSEKFQLTFPILSDETHTVIESYGAWAPKKFMGKEFLGTQRKTYLIDPKGIIQKIYTTVSVQTHADQIISDVKTYSV